MFCRVEGVPRAEVLPLLERVQDWDSPKGYLDHLERAAARAQRLLVPRPLGRSAPTSWDSAGRCRTTTSSPPPAELDRMAGMLDEALDVGYLGLSINTLPWDKMDGDRFRSRPTPSVFATWKEYRFLAEVLRRRDAVLEGVPDISAAAGTCCCSRRSPAASAASRCAPRSSR